MSVLRRIKNIAHAGLRRFQSPTPVVSVILPFFNVADYLLEAVTSLVDQSLRDIEIILVDDGSDDESAEIAHSFSQLDHRIRVITQANAGPGAARNAGLAAARGKYLSFVDSDDRLPPGALELLVNSARANDADVAVGALRRFDSTRRWVPEWVKGVHATSRSGITLDDFPALLRNNYPVGKVYRRAFWLEQGLSFRLGVIYEDQPLIAQMLLRAGRINVVTDIVYEYRRRDDRSSISQRPEELRDLRDRVSAWKISLSALRTEAPEVVIAGWYSTVYDTHLHWYLNNDSIFDEEYWLILREALHELREHEPEGALERVSPERRVPLLLLDLGLHEELIAFRNEGGYELTHFPSTVTPAGLIHALPVSEPTLLALPANALLTSVDKLILQQQLVRGTWRGEGEDLLLRISGSAYIPTIDLRSQQTRIEITATNEATGAVGRAIVRRVDDPLLFPSSPGDPSSYRRAGYVADINVHELLSDDETPEEWSLSVRVETGALVMMEPLRNVSPKGALTEMGSRMMGRNSRVRFAAGENRHVGARIVFETPAVFVESATCDNRRVHLRFRSINDRPIVKVHFRAEGHKAAFVVSTTENADSSFEATAELPPLEVREDQATPVISWTVRAEDDLGRQVALSWAEGRMSAVPQGTGTLRVYGAATGNLKLEEFPHGCVFVSDIEAGESGIVFFTAHLLATPGTAVAALSVGPAEVKTTTMEANQPESAKFSVLFRDEVPRPEDAGLDNVSAVVGGVGGINAKTPLVLSAVVLEKMPLAVPGQPVVLERTRGRALQVRRVIPSERAVDTDGHD